MIDIVKKLNPKEILAKTFKNKRTLKFVKEWIDTLIIEYSNEEHWRFYYKKNTKLVEKAFWKDTAENHTKEENRANIIKQIKMNWDDSVFFGLQIIDKDLNRSDIRYSLKSFPREEKVEVKKEKEPDPKKETRKEKPIYPDIQTTRLIKLIEGITWINNFNEENIYNLMKGKTEEQIKKILIPKLLKKALEQQKKTNDIMKKIRKEIYKFDLDKLTKKQEDLIKKLLKQKKDNKNAIENVNKNIKLAINKWKSK